MSEYGRKEPPGNKPGGLVDILVAITFIMGGGVGGFFLGTVIGPDYLCFVFAILGAPVGLLIGRKVVNFIWKRRTSKDLRQKKEKEPAESGPIMKP